MGDATTILSLAVAVIVILTAIVKLQSNLFEKMKLMMKEVVSNHSTDSEAHKDIRADVQEYFEELAEHRKDDAAWKVDHEKWGQKVKDEILAAIRNGYHEK